MNTDFSLKYDGFTSIQSSVPFYKFSKFDHYLTGLSTDYIVKIYTNRNCKVQSIYTGEWKNSLEVYSFGFQC